MTSLPSQLPMDPEGPTGRLCTWVESLKYEDIPTDIQTRAKYLILDGLACGLIGAHLPSSEKAAAAILDLETTSGSASVFGWERKIGPLSAVLLNGTFIQGFELDDWHRDAPIHSNSVLLPALLAATEHYGPSAGDSSELRYSGKDLLLAYIIGCEIGPRVGLGLWGTHVLSKGWHSGAIFGPSAAAAAVAKLFGLSAAAIEDALGIACTQAGGLMSAQFESEVKRMQHAFASRNGLLAAVLAKGGYVGIKKVYEREYGGFLAMFSSGNGMEPQFKPDEVAKDLGVKWEIEGIMVKPYASMAGTHCTVDCMAALRRLYPAQTRDFSNFEGILIEMSEPAYHHGGWKAVRPLTSTGAQMSNAYIGAVYLVDEQVTPAQFRNDKLDRDEVWRLVNITTCEHNPEYSKSSQEKAKTKVTITFRDGSAPLSYEQGAPRGVQPPLSNEEVLDKWRTVTKDIIDEERRSRIEQVVLALDECDDIAAISRLMIGLTANPLA
ncbi:Cis-aconitate decarboxylase [Daldinia childiae]|uniref:Cis-aconitate decarboxylase n=1 Tax=Daldinia childiae TaxID=326645 RepID=UPI001447D5AC|nr:Cis-aconitate decarboxylase [Daldinia childiae]KAF3056279.1 Cis-aconitate decarboxylase [Daldinia childiae]